MWNTKCLDPAGCRSAPRRAKTGICGFPISESRTRSAGSIEKHGSLRSSRERLGDWVSPESAGPGDGKVYGILGRRGSHVRPRTGQGRKHLVYESRYGPDRESGLEDVEDQAVGRPDQGWVRAANRTRFERQRVVRRISEWQDRPVRPENRDVQGIQL